MIVSRKIKFFGAFLIICTFLLNSVPKVFLHNVFANHQHTTNTSSSAKYTDLRIEAKQTCDCEDLFTETLFFANSSKVFFGKNYSNVEPTVLKVQYRYSLTTTQYLRGPPVVA